MGIAEDFNAVKLPVAAVMLLSILASLVVLVPTLVMIVCIFMPLIFLGYAAIGWVGAQRNLALQNTVIVAAIAIIIVTIIEYALYFILYAIGFSLTSTVGGIVVDLTPQISAEYIISHVIGLIVGVVEAVILTAIGHFVYSLLNKKK
jgi:hypothetical protein